jgi:hypothetical protein
MPTVGRSIRPGAQLPAAGGLVRDLIKDPTAAFEDGIGAGTIAFPTPGAVYGLRRCPARGAPQAPDRRGAAGVQRVRGVLTTLVFGLCERHRRGARSARRPARRSEAARTSRAHMRGKRLGGGVRGTRPMAPHRRPRRDARVHQDLGAYRRPVRAGIYPATYEATPERTRSAGRRRRNPASCCIMSHVFDSACSAATGTGQLTTGVAGWLKSCHPDTNSDAGRSVSCGCRWTGRPQ